MVTYLLKEKLQIPEFTLLLSFTCKQKLVISYQQIVRLSIRQLNLRKFFALTSKNVPNPSMALVSLDELDLGLSRDLTFVHKQSTEKLQPAASSSLSLKVQRQFTFLGVIFLAIGHTGLSQAEGLWGLQPPIYGQIS